MTAARDQDGLDDVVRSHEQEYAPDCREDSPADLAIGTQQGFGAHSAGFFLYYSPDTFGPGVRDEALRGGP